MTETKTILLKDLVEQKRKQYGWPHLRHSPTMDTIQKIPDTYWKEQHDNGKTLKQVAQELKISPGYLSKILNKKGIYWRELEYDIQNRLIKKDGNYLARLTDKEAHRIVDELNRQDRKLNEYERTIAKIRKILRS